MFEDDPDKPIYSKLDIILAIIFGSIFVGLLLFAMFSYEILKYFKL